MKLLQELTNTRVPTQRQIANEIQAQRRIRREPLSRERRPRGLLEYGVQQLSRLR
jgi:hypothetical protein